MPHATKTRLTWSGQANAHPDGDHITVPASDGRENVDLVLGREAAEQLRDALDTALANLDKNAAMSRNERFTARLTRELTARGLAVTDSGAEIRLLWVTVRATAPSAVAQPGDLLTAHRFEDYQWGWTLNAPEPGDVGPVLQDGWVPETLATASPEAVAGTVNGLLNDR